MQAQLPPSQQQSFQYGHPDPSQSQQYSHGIIQHSRPQSADYINGYQNGGAIDMNPYQQYAGGYGQPSLPPQHPQHPQHPQQQQQQQQHQHQQLPNVNRPYHMQNQLPPLVPQLGPPTSMMPPVRDDPSAHPASSANTTQPSAYTLAPPMPQQQLPPPSASRPPVPAPEKKMSHTTVRDGYRYSLEVVQQPQRARMCGFGDKDRRPITPPPCVRLAIVDVESGREIDVNEIQSDPSFFVLQVDLWAESADREANVVRASSNSPAVSISSATTTSYPPPSEHPPRSIDQTVMYVHPETGQTVYGTVPGYAVSFTRPGMLPPQVSPFGGNMYYPHAPAPAPNPYWPPSQSSSAMYTRNLIGSLTVNASRLTDTEGKLGYWFVLQDLSVRTEGFFRLRMSFIDISAQGGPGVIKGKAPVLAWTFSDKFQVYSAKKFPGVIESTPLSKCFAGQGIKIPIRKDNKNDANDDDDGD